MASENLREYLEAARQRRVHEQDARKQEMAARHEARRRDFEAGQSRSMSMSSECLRERERTSPKQARNWSTNSTAIMLVSSSKTPGSSSRSEVLARRGPCAAAEAQQSRRLPPAPLSWVKVKNSDCVRR